MLRTYVTICALLVVVTASTADAVTYSWTDEQGTVNFSEDLGSVPKQFRKKARKIQDTEPQPEEQPVPSPDAGKAPKVAPTAADSDGGSTDGKYAGKTYGQWEKDLRDREAAMAAVRKEIDEIDGQLRTGTAKTKVLLEKRAGLLAQFKQMKVEYDQLIESARQAGLQVNIEK